MAIDATIRRLVNEFSIGDQRALRKLLAGEGYVVAQPTLSRHLKRLSIAKREGRYQEVDRLNRESYRYTLLAAPPNLLVVKTEPGHGQLLAVMIDQHSIEGMAGTVAGDDTIFVALEKPEHLASVKEQIAQLFGRR
jgi:transcriptional regulator of arginine metabolism